MIYERTLTLFSAHFNDEKAYTLWGQIKADDMASASDVRALLSSLHGHNFKVQVRVEGPLAAKDHFVVADEEIEEACSRYASRCLSVLPEFETVRATTENLAAQIAVEVATIVRAKPADVTVRVYEADDRWAEHSLRVVA